MIGEGSPCYALGMIGSLYRVDDAFAREIDLPPPPPGSYRMYAIAFDLDTEELQKRYPTESWRNGYADIRRILVDEGFVWKQGSVMFGDREKVDAVRCVLVAQRLTRELPWFATVVRDLRMLRIEENNDLLPAIEDA